MIVYPYDDLRPEVTVTVIVDAAVQRAALHADGTCLKPKCRKAWESTHPDQRGLRYPGAILYSVE